MFGILPETSPCVPLRLSIWLFSCVFGASLVALRVKCLPAIRETWVRFLEKEIETHSSTLAWKIPWTEKPVGYSLGGHKESDMTERLHFHFLIINQ